MHESDGYCPYCRRRVLVRRPSVNHTTHAIVTLFLCGLWLPVWGLIALINADKPWRCTCCGSSEIYES